MKIRSFIILRVTPIFVALAAANSGALYWAQSKEIEANLAEEIQASTVTLSEYFAAKPELADRLRSASGRSALTVAMAQLPGLDSIALYDSSGRCCLVQAGSSPEGQVTPRGSVLKPTVSGVLRRKSGEAFVRSTIRLPHGEVLALEVDADRSEAQRRSLLWRCSLILASGGLAGIFVSMLITSWLTADLRSLRQLITGRNTKAQRTRFVETQDVADAVTMLRVNLKTVADLNKQSLTGNQA